MAKSRMALQLEVAEAKIVELTKELEQTTDCYNAVITYILGPGYMEEPMEFLRCWNQGDFDACREEWPDAPRECYVGADPLFKD